jgi:hypothetical protein
MIEFESFCFLQNHKTSCTLVETFLRAHCSEDIVRYEKHWAPPARRPGRFHFVGVREPLDTYLSLFNYGLDGRGEIFLRFNAAGMGTLYAAGIDGFAEWLRHAFAHLDDALAWLAAPPRINASQRRDRSSMPHVPAELRAQLADRERVLYDAFYPEQRPDRIPSP